ncbi:MAG: hypothetical protein U1F56_03600 [Rubrivivax sp.]
MKLLILCVLGLFAALLAGCGGGGGNAAEAESSDARDVPSRALASPEAFSQFVGALKADDQAEPLPLGTLTPPTSDSAEPIDG